MNDKKICAAYSEALLRLAVIENHKRELAAIPPREELEKVYSFSPEHEARMAKLFSKKSRKSIPPTLAFRRVAAAIVIVAALTFGMLLTNAEVRAAAWNTMFEWYSEFTRFIFRSSDSVAGNICWEPSYLPVRFTETNREMVGDFTIVDFTDSLGNTISFNYNSSEAAWSVDNEHSEYSTVTRDGVLYHVYTAISDEYPSMIIWELNGYSFLLKSTIKPDELIKIAFSVGQSEP